MPSIGKSLGDITITDLEMLCRDKVTEDEQIDFKETVPSRSDKGGDPWREKRTIADHGRDQLLAAVVGFANAYGGDLVVGVKEDGEKPGGADAVVPIEDCEELAHRVLQQANVCIEPPIPSLNARGIVTDENGSGVVIVRVARSRLAPHRLKTTLECYQRVRHETLPMSMRQIQDLTFSVSRGLDAVDRRFAEMRSRFSSWAQFTAPPAGSKRFCFRVTAVPASGDCQLQKVHNVDEVRPRERVVRWRPRIAGAVAELHVPFNVYQWEPVLRGSVGKTEDSDKRARLSVFCDGVVSYECSFDMIEAAVYVQRTYIFYYGWLFACIVNAIEGADRFRQQASAAGAEYALEIEILASHALHTVTIDRNGFMSAIGTFSPGAHLFPRYVIGGKELWPEVLTLIWRDFWNSLGSTVPDDQVELDPPV
jgi:hypothetical protein